MNRWTIALPLMVVVGSVVWLGSRMPMPHDAAGEMHIRAFARTPVADHGRVKPYDTLARVSLTIISDRESFFEEVAPEGEAEGAEPQLVERPAIRWLLDVVSHHPAALDHKVFRIENPDVLTLLGLEERTEPRAHKFRYALSEIVQRDNVERIHREAMRARQAISEKRTVSAFDRKMIELQDQLQLYQALAQSHEFPPIREGAVREDLPRIIARYRALEQATIPHPVPPRGEGETWKPFMRASLEALVAEPSDALRTLAIMLHSYGNPQRTDEQVEAFNTAVARYHESLEADPPPDVSMAKLDFEVFFNHLQPFYLGSVLYVGAFVFCALSWLGFTEPLRRAALGLIVVTFVLHTAALGARIYISGYPPVTNLYSSAIFIGWGAVLFGIVLEWIYRLGVGNLVAAVLGFATLLIAHYLAGSGDTLEMMQAVLDTQFWLATHVVTITLGYTATYIAGALAIDYLLRAVFTRTIDRPKQQAYYRMMYGTICFAMLFSFVGTVLGGLWADDSWGRFWGWDPKENGALIIVLWNALILHARWAGLVQVRGLAILAVFGNIVTAWSWFGVNQLGVGLHSYGFTDGVVMALLVFVASQIVIMAIGLAAPRHPWLSHREAPDEGGSAPARAPQTA